MTFRCVYIGLLFLATTACSDSDDEVATTSLKIVLVNDDGFDKIGIRAMHKMLTAAGHEVILVAPDGNRSGVSASLSFGEGEPEKAELGIHSFDATPATCAFAGLAMFDGKADLLISGTNDQPNVGAAIAGSGTIGAMATGLYNNVPAIAVSTYQSVGLFADSEGHHAHFEHIGKLVADLIVHFQTHAHELGDPEGLLPDGVGLSINFPPRMPEDIGGLKVSEQGLNAFAYIGGRRTYFGPEVPESNKADTEHFLDGYVSVAPLAVDFSAGGHDDWVDALMGDRGDGTPGEPLTILLTGEALWDSAAMTTTRTALEAAGHTVRLAAPGEPTRGGSTASATSNPCEYVEQPGGELAIKGPPSRCLELVLRSYGDTPPDLVVSGINESVENGRNLLYSGAVGAARASAIRLVPAIAIHTSSGVDGEPVAADHLQSVANYLVGLIDHLQTKPGSFASAQGLLPEATALNINYPGPNGELGTPMITYQGRSAPYSYHFLGDGKLMSDTGPAIAAEDGEDTDTASLAAGHISLTPMTPDFTAPSSVIAMFETTLEGFVMEMDVDREADPPPRDGGQDGGDPDSDASAQ